MQKPLFPVILAGVLTTALTLFGVYLLNIYAEDFNIMGWYWAGIFPAGAFLVGMLAASGYGLVMWLMGIRISKEALFAILGLQVLAYGAAQYIEYLSVLKMLQGMTVIADGQTIRPGEMSFVEYFDVTARAIAFEGRNGEPGSPLGVLGYGIRFLEVIGFCGGSLVVPAALRSHPFCEGCQRYMRGRQLTLIPASIPTKLFQKRDKEADATAFADGTARMEQLRKLTTENRAGEFVSILEELKGSQKEAAGLPNRYSVEAVSCPDCKNGFLRVARLEGQGRSMKRHEMPEARVEAPSGFLTSI
ncbi:MAG: hypothetical protein OHK0029_08920 [Armatimonadaceae bacterium]